MGGGGHQPEKIGHGSRAENGHPVAADIRVVGGKPNLFIFPETGDEARSPPHRSATCTTRSRCGGDRDGRTMVAFVSGWCGSHDAVISSNHN